MTDNPIKERKKKYGARTEMLASRIPVYLHEKIEQKADETGVSKTEVVVKALKRGLSRERKPRPVGAFE